MPRAGDTGVLRRASELSPNLISCFAVRNLCNSELFSYMRLPSAQHAHLNPP
jgi:hypothetical protein